MLTYLVDVRCLQDPPFRERGIGRHARALLSHARALLPGSRIAGISDPGLPALPADVHAMLDEVRLTAYPGALSTATAFVQLSPMTHDPIFVARLLHHPAIATATVVYDFIPLDDPARYLPEAATRIDYHVALRWLARHDLFLPISADASARLQKLLGVSERRIAVTGAPLTPAFEHLTPLAPAHILVVGGSDPRKNPECAIRAHAQARAVQAARVPLVVTGAYPAVWVEEQQRIAASLGGDPDLLQAPGHVDEVRLHELYAGATLVVTPSFAEGFSLPVIEAMAAGIPVVASDIPAHRELLDAGLFAPDDPTALAALMDAAMSKPWRHAALDRQALVWPRFREGEVARRFWGPVSEMAPSSAPSVVHRKPRVAVLTPLPPDQSGVADYSAAMCEELGKRVELHVFTPTVSPRGPSTAAFVGPLTKLPMVSSSFDRTVAVLGNSVFHLEILKLLLRFGGAAILHDSRMLDLYAGHMTLEKTVAMAEEELSRRLQPNEIWRWLAGETAPEALILAEVAAAAEPLLMHSSEAVAEVERRYGVAATYLPFSLQRTILDSELTPERRAQARVRLGIADTDLLIASFGYVHPTKAPIDCIWTLDLLRAWGFPAVLHFVGAPLMPTHTLQALIDELGLADAVRLTPDFVDEQTYRDYLVGADLGLQLRPGGSGAVSGALSDCIACGLPTVASRSLALALDPPDFVLPVPDAPSPVLIAEAAALLLARPSPRAARRAYVASHGFDTYTDGLCAALGLP